MSRVLSHLHDSNANIAEFTSNFNGENKHVIRFIFDIQRYEQITNFQNPDTLFTNIYNKLPPWIQHKFAQDKVNTIDRQQATLAENATELEKIEANKYTVEQMQKFFIKNYRPTCKRTNIFRLLYSIKMRYNENPRTVVDRIATAVGYAKKTIRLINECGGEQMQTISDDDVTTILANIFCNTNNCAAYQNQGGINLLMQKAVRKAKPAYESTAVPPNRPVLLKKYYEIAEEIVSNVAGKWYAKDKRYEMKYYDPQPLPLWETIIKKPTPITTPKPQFKPKRQQSHIQNDNRKRKNQWQNQPYGPARKRSKFNPNPNPNPHIKLPTPSSTSNSNNVQCFRCGFKGHRANDCKSGRDINNVRFARHERRTLKEMPFKSTFKQPRPYVPTRPQNTSPRAPQFNPIPSNNRGYNQYPSGTTNNSQLNPSQNTQFTPQLHTLISELTNAAAQDQRINPDVLHAIQSLQEHVNNNNHNPSARQSS